MASGARQEKELGGAELHERLRVLCSSNVRVTNAEAGGGVSTGNSLLVRRRARLGVRQEKPSIVAQGQDERGRCGGCLDIVAHSYAGAGSDAEDVSERVDDRVVR